MARRKLRVNPNDEPQTGYRLIGADYEITPIPDEEHPDQIPFDGVFSSPMGDFIGIVCHRGRTDEYVGRVQDHETGEFYLAPDNWRDLIIRKVQETT